MALRPSSHCSAPSEGCSSTVSTSFRRWVPRPSLVLTHPSPALGWPSCPALLVVGRTREGGGAPGFGSPRPRFDHAISTRPRGRRCRMCPWLRPSGPCSSARRCAAAPGWRPRSLWSTWPAGCWPAVVAVVATALAARRRAHLPAAGDPVDLGHPRRAARAVLPRRAPSGPAGLAGRGAVGAVGPGLRRLQPDHRPARSSCRVVPLVLAVTAWGMFIRARRQLLLTLRERAQRAEADQRSARRPGTAGRAHPDRPGDARRARPPDLAAGAARRRAGGPTRPAPGEGAGDRRADALHRPPGTRGAAQRDRRAARGARAQEPTPPAPQPTLSDIPRLVEETRQSRRGDRLRHAGGARRRRTRARSDAMRTASCRRR